METLLKMVDAQSTRDTVRRAILAELRTLPTLTPDLLALLLADANATAAFEAAVREHTTQGQR